MQATLLTITLILDAVTPAATAPRAYVVGAAPGRAPGDRALQVRRSTSVTLYAVVRLGRGWRARYYTDAPSVRLGGRRIPRRRIRPLKGLAGLRIRWLQVEPYPHHQKRPYPNPNDPTYANAVLYGKRHGRWLGLDRLEYHQTPIPRAHGTWLRVTRAAPSSKKAKGYGGLGTMRYRVQVTWAGGRASSPGASASGRGGIGRGVLRVSWREGDDLVGWLTSYYNVPYVFGSARVGGRHQTEEYQGADCADVIVGAARRAGARLGYTNASGLTRYARKVTPKLLMTKHGFTHAEGPRKGRRARLRFGTDVRRGDMVLIDYSGLGATGRSWDHVGVMSADRGRKGWLDPADRHIHTGNLYGVLIEPLSREGKAVVQFLRLRTRYRRAIARQQKRLQRARVRRAKRLAKRRAANR